MPGVPGVPVVRGACRDALGVLGVSGVPGVPVVCGACRDALGLLGVSGVCRDVLGVPCVPGECETKACRFLHAHISHRKS